MSSDRKSINQTSRHDNELRDWVENMPVENEWDSFSPGIFSTHSRDNTQRKKNYCARLYSFFLSLRLPSFTTIKVPKSVHTKLFLCHWWKAIKKDEIVFSYLCRPDNWQPFCHFEFFLWTSCDSSVWRRKKREKV